MNEIIRDQAEKERSAIAVATVVYALQALWFVVGIFYIVSVIINYVKQEDVRGTLAESHFRWQIRTFWFSMLWTVLGGLTFWIGIGFVIWAGTVIWVVYRIVKGWLYLNDRKPMLIH